MRRVLWALIWLAGIGAIAFLLFQGSGNDALEPGSGGEERR